MDGKGSASGSVSALPTLDLNVLLGRRTLNKHLETEKPFDNNKITPFYQRIFRSLIEAISIMESSGITRGYLEPDQIMVGGGLFTRAWLLNKPEEDNPTAPTYREQFDSLVRMILGEEDLSNLELNHFLHITTSAASGRQSLKGTSSWKEDFRQMIQRDVEVRNTVLGVDYFLDVYNLEGPQYYEENALGAFLFSANAISDVNGCVQKAFNQYMKDEEKGKKLMTVEQIFDRLTSFFPHLFIDVYDFLVKKGLPIDIVI